MPKYPYKTIGLPLDLANWERLNKNFDDIESDLRGISSDVLAELIHKAKLEFKQPVSTFVELSTTYPNAKEGWAAQTLDTQKIYRYDGSAWLFVMQGSTEVAPILDEIEGARDGEANLQERLLRDYEKIGSDVFYSEITTTKNYDAISKTTYYLIRVPRLDADGDVIDLKHGYQNDVFNSGTGETARSFANRNMTSLTVNASRFNVTTGAASGIQIRDGELLQNNVESQYDTLGILADGTLRHYPPLTSGNTMIEDGVVQSFAAFYHVIDNGNARDLGTLPAGSSQVFERHPRTVIAQHDNKDIVFLISEGRYSDSPGMTYEDVIRILSAEGVRFAYVLDGGGSTQAVLGGYQINDPVDEKFTKERLVTDFIYIKKENDVAPLLSTTTRTIGEVKKQLSDTRAELYEMQNTSDTSWINATYQNGWTTSAGRPAQYRKNGNVLHVRGVVTGGTTGDNVSNAVFTLPEGYRPTRTMIGLSNGLSASSIQFTRATVQANGNVTISGDVAGATGYSIDLVIPL